MPPASSQVVQSPISHAPARVRRYGLTDAHKRPLVSHGKRNGSFSGSFRVDPAKAWEYPSIELRAANSWPNLILDCDHQNSLELLSEALSVGKLPQPNWLVSRRANGHTHAVWNLRKPVHRGPASRASPLRYFARVSEYFAHTIDADSGYTGVLTHNPMASVHNGEMLTKWLREAPYELNELAEVIPLDWRIPKLTKSPVGNNCTLFNACMKWAGSPHNLGREVLRTALILNQELSKPLPLSEVRGIAKSVERYRRQWINQGRYFDVSPEAISSRQRDCGLKSGKARRKGTVLEFNREPWLELGVSRATWYRNYR